MRRPGKVKRLSVPACHLLVIWLGSIFVQFIVSKKLAIEFRIDSWPVHRLALITLGMALVMMATAFALYSKYSHEVAIVLAVIVVLIVVPWGLGRYDLETSFIYTGTVLQNLQGKSLYMPTMIILSIFLCWLDAGSKE